MSPTGSPVPSSSALLSYPAPDAGPSRASSSLFQPRQRELLKDRLYVGNLHPTVDEHILIQVFSKYGKLAHLDFLFHKSGPMKGKPRGFAFIEYSDQTDAEKALASANGKLLRGRRLVVTFAHQAPLDQAGSSIHRRSVNEAGRPTALSMLKSVNGKDRTKDKIAQMEAKLRQLEQSPESSTRPYPHTPISHPPTSPSRRSLQPTTHPSLPSRPVTTPAPSPALAQPQPPAVRPRANAPSSSSASPFLHESPVAPPLELSLTVGTAPSRKVTGANLKGVKIMKKRKDGASRGGEVEGT
ncbi:RNA-binding domain-containing protein [Artomyces pyxidatus]|uniref:RNA-binding domain-containing protein n=1 Tax=Artomyces pyxidatus TaxID=48021 RepID=A0ACB8TG30_9AGAM|nr:RNA-binding domain-containing protein [Artomyces pyxidatus]